MARIIVSGRTQQRLYAGNKPGPILRLVPPSPNRNPDSFEEIRTMKGSGDYSLVSDSDRVEIIEMIGFGWTDDEILQMLPHIEKGSVTAYRAHVTRGTYDLGVINGVGRNRVDR